MAAILIKEDGTKELIGGVYDEKTKTIKFSTNKYGKFMPRKNTTRTEIATMLYRLYDLILK